jgi:Tetracyclin repressor-like, C-terminal domain
VTGGVPGPADHDDRFAVAGHSLGAGAGKDGIGGRAQAALERVRDAACDELIVLLRTAVTSEAVAAQLLGLALCRYILRLEPLASLPARDVVTTIAPSVQRYLTQAVVPAVPLR